MLWRHLRPGDTLIFNRNEYNYALMVISVIEQASPGIIMTEVRVMWLWCSFGKHGFFTKLAFWHENIEGCEVVRV